MTLEESIEKVRQYYDETENREWALEALGKLLAQVVGYPEHLAQFERLAADLGGGMFIPYLFWVEMSKYMDNKGDRDAIFHLIRAFVESDFEEEEREKMRPLLIVYFKREGGSFEISKIKAKILDDAHKDVKAYFKEVEQYPERNPSATETLLKKMHLLRRQFPQFDLFKLTVQQIEEQLSARAST
jgi:hypothetical protein